MPGSRLSLKPKQRCRNVTCKYTLQDTGKTKQTAIPKRGHKKKISSVMKDSLRSNGVITSSPLTPAKPSRFSWVVDGFLAAHGRPTKPEHIQYLCDNNIHVLVSLTQNKPTVINKYSGGLQWVHIPIKDEKPPTLEQVDQFLQVVQQAKDDGKNVSLHCAWGRGRTGTLLACYLAKEDNISAEEAINLVRRLRPGSIDTEQQKQLVDDFVQKQKNLDK